MGIRKLNKEEMRKEEAVSKRWVIFAVLIMIAILVGCSIMQSNDTTPPSLPPWEDPGYYDGGLYYD